MVCLAKAGLLLTAASSAAASFVSSVIPGAYIVEYEDNHDAGIMASSVESYGNVRMRFNSRVFKGVSVQMDDVEKAKTNARIMAKSPGVKAMWPISLHSRPDYRVQWVANETNIHSLTTLPIDANRTASPYSPHVMTQVDKLHAKGYTGKGVRLAIVDTGIDYKHPALGGCFGEGCLVVKGHDFTGDDYTGRNSPVPDDDPMDCDGHGSHLAGIIAAQADKNQLGIVGAAPGLTLGAYRIFGCYGSAADDVVLSGITRAYEDGADIISLSIGSPVGWSSYPWSVVIERIIDAGVPTIVAAGNEGDAGVFFASSPSDARGAAAVGCIDNIRTPGFLQLSNYTVADKNGKNPKSEKFLYQSTYEKPTKSSFTLKALSLSDVPPEKEACEALPEDTPDLSKYITLVREGGCSYGVKATNLAAKGARAIIVYNDNDDHFPAKVYSFPWDVKTNVAVDAATGRKWIKLMKAGKQLVVSFPDEADEVNTLHETKNAVSGGAITPFSSWGPTWDMDVKPQFAAPGGNILSTYPLRKGGYAVVSGTSMSTPLVAAIYALIHEVRGTLDPKLISNLLSSTALAQRFHDGTKFSSFLAPVAQQGAGAVQAYTAAFASTYLEPASLSFNDTDHFRKSLNFSLRYDGRRHSVTYKISHVASHTVLTINATSGNPATFPNEMIDAPASLKFSVDEVRAVKGQPATVVNVVATPPANVDAKRLALWSGWIVINGTDGSSLTIPYQGLTGSLRDSTILDEEEGAWMSIFDRKIKAVEEGRLFHLPPQGTEAINDYPGVPLLVANIRLGTRVVRAELLPKGTANDSIVLGEHPEYPKLWNQRGSHIVNWGGKLLGKKEYAPEGSYRFRVRALHLYGDESNPDDWDVRYTQGFRIVYDKAKNETA